MYEGSIDKGMSTLRSVGVGGHCPRSINLSLVIMYLTIIEIASR